MEYSTLEISENQAAAYAEKYYGLSGAVKKLPGEEDFNFYLKSVDGKKYTIKISRPGTELEAIDFQAAVMNYLSRSKFPVEFPKVVTSLNNSVFIELDEKRFLRVQKWVPGRMLAEVNPRSPKILENWGEVCGYLSFHLAKFDHEAAHRFYKWNPSETLFSRQYKQYIEGSERTEMADHFWGLFETKALPYLAELRKSVNYNDAHEHNFLVDFNYKSPRITGIIDFGDALYCETINELAIACAYACMYFPDPLQAAAHVVKGYHKIYPIEEKELAVLFPLIGARLMITAANAAFNKHKEPDNEYLLISEKPAWDLLTKLRNISPDFAEATFRNACGYTPSSKAAIFQKWIEFNKGQFAQVIDFDNKIVVPFDLAVDSKELGNNSNFGNIKNFQKTIARLLEDKEGDIGVGGYGETRPVYTTDAYQIEGNSGAQWRTVHLGLDIWGAAGIPVYSPLDATVFSIQNNAEDRDYGPTIILEHTVTEELTFYTLYGHLGNECLENFVEGEAIVKGQQIATIGSPPDNGNWPPHLHYQVILEMLDEKGDYPGVAFPSEAKIWKSLCPDPGLFFKSLPELPNNTDATAILHSRKEHLGRSLSISYDQPLHMVRGYKQYLYDTSGRRYLDTVNNVPHVGHQHPRVVEAAQQQMGVLNTNTRYLHENITSYAESLLETFPPELSVVHFVNSGSEANELAMRMVEAFSGQKDMVAVEVGYHGNTGACIAVSSYKFDGKGGKGAPPHTHIVPIPDTFRGLYKSDKEAGTKYAAHIKEAIDKIQSEGRNVGGFICESIISCGGQIVLPENYLKEAYNYIRSAGGICISDEVQVGFGRIGEHFWGFELQGVVPDIVTLGKPIGNGHPLAAVVTTQKVAEAFANGMEYFNTFGGNPVSCAVGKEVLDIIKEEGLQEHALKVGDYLKQGLERLQKIYPIIGDIRGFGLFLGFELVKDTETLEPAAEEASYLSNRMKERGILMSTDGPHYNVLKIKPPMCFNQDDADFLLENLDLVFSEDFMQIR
jgi:4-aminobutyrate aminotransferase-like enzyme/Ser/Thr protein kinase RdoA (MazF antagonist)/murein DD-endopeptidase MepM/ murein hydrolase activator NlpD